MCTRTEGWTFAWLKVRKSRSLSCQKVLLNQSDAHASSTASQCFTMHWTGLMSLPHVHWLSIAASLTSAIRRVLLVLHWMRWACLSNEALYGLICYLQIQLLCVYTLHRMILHGNFNDNRQARAATFCLSDPFSAWLSSAKHVTLFADLMNRHVLHKTKSFGVACFAIPAMASHLSHWTQAESHVAHENAS